MPNCSIPFGHTLLDTDESVGNKVSYLMIVDVGDMIIHKHPPKLSSMHFMWVYVRLHTPSKALPYCFKQMAFHPHLHKVKFREILISWYDIPTKPTISSFNSGEYDQISFEHEQLPL